MSLVNINQPSINIYRSNSFPQPPSRGPPPSSYAISIPTSHYHSSIRDPSTQKPPFTITQIYQTYHPTSPPQPLSRTCRTEVLMQKRRETKLKQIRDPSHLFKMSDFPLLLFLIQFRFSPSHPLPFFSSVFAPLPDRLNKESVETFVDCSVCLFFVNLWLGKMLPSDETATCESNQTRDRRYGDVFLNESIRFSMYIEIFGLTEHWHLYPPPHTPYFHNIPLTQNPYLLPRNHTANI